MAEGRGRGTPAPPILPRPSPAEAFLPGSRLPRRVGGSEVHKARAQGRNRHLGEGHRGRRPRAARPRPVTFVGRRRPRQLPAPRPRLPPPLPRFPAGRGSWARSVRAAGGGRAARASPREGGGAAEGGGSRRRGGGAGRVGLHWLSLPRSDIHARPAASSGAEALIPGEADSAPAEELGVPALSPLAPEHQCQVCASCETPFPPSPGGGRGRRVDPF